SPSAPGYAGDSSRVELQNDPKATHMTKRIALPLILVPCVIAVACLSAHSARDESQSSWKSLEQQYAEANLELAQARLAVAQSQNKSVAGTISKETMDDLQSGVQVARDWLKQLVVNKNPNQYSPRAAALEGTIQALETNYAEALKANE